MNKSKSIMCECCTVKVNQNNIIESTYKGSDYHDKHITYTEYLCNTCYTGINNFKLNDCSIQG